MNEVRFVVDGARKEEVQALLDPTAETGQEATSYSLEQALDAAGYGRFQRKLLFISGVGFGAGTMELLLVSFLIHELEHVWGTFSSLENALLAGAVFSGSMLGSLFWGVISDRYGRKPAYVLTMLLSTVFGVATALAPDLAWVVAFRFAVGFAVGGCLSVDMLLCIEFLPAKHRGAHVTLVTLCGVAGVLGVTSIAWATIPTLGWRWFVALCALPGASVLLLRVWACESPRFLLTAGRVREAEAVLEMVARENGTTLPPGRLRAEHAGVGAEGRGRFCDLLAPSLRRRSLTMWAVWFFLTYGYYGIVVWLPSYLKKKHLANTLYRTFLIMGLAELPGLLLARASIDRIGRKMSLMIGLVGTSASAALFPFASSSLAVTATLAASFFFVVQAWNALYQLTPELYPTTLRATASGGTSVWATGGGAVSPIVGALLLGSGTDEAGWVLGMYAAAFLAGALVLAQLPVPKDGELADVLREKQGRVM